MKLAFLEHPADLPVVIRRQGIGARLRMAPRARKIRAILRLQKADQGHLTHYRSPSEIAGAHGGSRDRAYSCHWSRPKNVLTNRSPGHDRAAHLVQSGFQRALVLRPG